MDDKQEKWMWIVTGPNGSGKSTFARTQMLTKNADLRHFDPDARAMEIYKAAGDATALDNDDVYLQVDDENLAAIARCEKNGQSFVIETTAPGNTYTWMAEDLKKKGWKIGIIVLGIDSLELANSRINERVHNGGHEGAEPVIAQHYWSECLKNTPKFLRVGDTVHIYDNSGKGFVKIASRIGSEKLTLAVSEEELRMRPYTHEMLNNIERISAFNTHPTAKGR